MVFVGIDLHKQYSYVVVLNTHGDVLDEQRSAKAGFSEDNSRRANRLSRVFVWLCEAIWHLKIVYDKTCYGKLSPLNSGCLPPC
jgi:hypothetical protein